jgi:ATP-dependent Lhr-like helicase
VWNGLATNDTFHPLRALTRARAPRRRGRRHTRPVGTFRSRRLIPPSAEGRWSALPTARPTKTEATAWIAATAQQLLARHGVLTRESLTVENVPGGFGVLYPVLKALEESGRIRRGYFVAGLGAAQFALPGAVDLLRSLRDAAGDGTDSGTEGQVDVAVLAATDPRIRTARR